MHKKYLHSKVKCRYFCRLTLDISPVYLTRGISEGDIIFFKNGDNLPIVHRCVRIEGDQYYTKGDKNKSEDWKPIKKEDIYGKVIFRWNAIAPLIQKFLV